MPVHRLPGKNVRMNLQMGMGEGPGAHYILAIYDTRFDTSFLNTLVLTIILMLYHLSSESSRLIIDYNTACM